MKIRRNVKPKVLVIDDEDAIREMVELTLSMRGMEVSGAPDGLRGLIAADKSRPDVIVMDVMMPGLNGFETVRKLRADVKLRDIPVIMLTAESSEDSQWEGWTAGVDSYVTKPLDADLLVTEIHRVLND
jgi:DNA-binding response OmpR family regulator